MKINRLAASALLVILGMGPAIAAAATTTRKPVRAKKAVKRVRRVATAKPRPNPIPVPAKATPIAAVTPAATPVPAQQVAQAQQSNEDERITKLRNFFLAQRSPLAKHAEVFLGASDKHGLDWRLLPSLAMVETGGLTRNNNVFGWGNGRIQFGSIAESIQVIAERLTNALPYRNKTLEGKLRAYNPVNRNYPTHVQGVMASIGPAAPAPTAAK